MKFVHLKLAKKPTKYIINRRHNIKNVLHCRILCPDYFPKDYTNIFVSVDTYRLYVCLMKGSFQHLQLWKCDKIKSVLTGIDEIVEFFSRVNCDHNIWGLDNYLNGKISTLLKYILTVHHRFGNFTHSGNIKINSTLTINFNNVRDLLVLFDDEDGNNVHKEIEIQKCPQLTALAVEILRGLGENYTAVPDKLVISNEKHISCDYSDCDVGLKKFMILSFASANDFTINEFQCKKNDECSYVIIDANQRYTISQSYPTLHAHVLIKLYYYGGITTVSFNLNNINELSKRFDLLFEYVLYHEDVIYLKALLKRLRIPYKKVKLDDVKTAIGNKNTKYHIRGIINCSGVTLPESSFYGFYIKK